MPIAGIPLVVRVLRWLATQGVRSAVLNLHHKPETITRCVGSGSGLGIGVRYSWEPTLLGTAGGPRRALSLLGPRFFIVNGDTLTDVGLGDLAAAHEASGADVTLAVTPHPAPHRYGRCPGGRRRVGTRIHRAGGRCRAPFRWDSAGRSLCLREPRGRAANGVDRGLYDLLAQRDRRVIWAHQVATTFHEVGTPAEYLAVSLAIAATEGHDTIPLGERSEVHTTASLLRTAVWNDVVIGAGCRLVDCVVTDGVRLPENSVYDGQAIVATGGQNGIADAHGPPPPRVTPVERPSPARLHRSDTMADRGPDHDAYADRVTPIWHVWPRGERDVHVRASR